MPQASTWAAAVLASSMTSTPGRNLHQGSLAGGATTTYLDGTVLGSTTYMYQIRGLFPATSTPNTARRCR